MSDYADKPAQYLDKAVIEQLDDHIEGALKLLRTNRTVLEKIADTSKLESILDEAIAEIKGWGGVRSAS